MDKLFTRSLVRRATLWPTRPQSIRLRSTRSSACAAQDFVDATADRAQGGDHPAAPSRSISGSPFLATSAKPSCAKERAWSSRATSDSAIRRGRPSRIHRKLLQSYLAWSDAVTAFVDKVDLDEQDRARAKLVTSMLVDALAPTNALLANPAAVKKLVDTGGDSLWSGLRNYVEDLIKNGGMPSQVDTKPFALGKNIATSDGRRGVSATRCSSSSSTSP